MISRKFSVRFLLYLFMLMSLMFFVLCCGSSDDNSSNNNSSTDNNDSNDNAKIYTEFGSWSYNSKTNELVLHWGMSNFPCNWPEAGTVETKTATITATQMVWTDSMTWTRSSGNADNPFGQWRTTNEDGKFILDLRSNGSVDLEGKINECSK